METTMNAIAIHSPLDPAISIHHQQWLTGALRQGTGQARAIDCVSVDS